MRSIDELLETKFVEPFVLATLVEVVGSNFRRPGARMVIKPDGTHIGTISGGCLEKDVARAAFAMTENGPEKVLYDTRSNQIYPRGKYGTGCEGMVFLLLERIEPDHSVLEIIKAELSNRNATVVAVIHEGPTATLGSFTELASRIETPIRHEIEHQIAASRTEKKSRQLIIEDDEQTTKVFVNYVSPTPRLLVFGAGTDAKSLASLAQLVGWESVLCFEDATQFLDGNYQTRTLNGPKTVPEIDGETAVVFISHQFEFDRKYLSSVLQSDAFYVGILGPKRRTASLMTESIGDSGEVDFDRIHAPVGLDLGSDEPKNIGLAILAEIVAFKNGRGGARLSDLDRPTHEKLEVVLRSVVTE